MKRALSLFGLVAFTVALSAPAGAADGTAANTEPGTQPAGNAAPPPGKQSAPGASNEIKSMNDFPKADVVPFTESTKVQGKIGVDLTGVWLLVAMPELAPGKYRSFPQLLKITQADGSPEIHLLDVQLPDQVQQSLKDANHALVGWTPSPETRQLLAQNWSTLPKAKQKAIDESLYGKIEYLVASPDRYGEAFATRSEGVDKALNGSKLGLKIVEDYQPRPLPAGTQVAQMMRRTTVYGVKSEEKNLLKGDIMVGFLAAGSGTPLPYNFSGPFAMYRLASL